MTLMTIIKLFIYLNIYLFIYNLFISIGTTCKLGAK